MIEKLLWQFHFVQLSHTHNERMNEHMYWNSTKLNETNFDSTWYESILVQTKFRCASKKTKKKTECKINDKELLFCDV